MIKAYESVKKWEEGGENIDLDERDALWSEKNNQIHFSFGKPMTLDGGIIVRIDAITLEVIKMGRWPLEEDSYRY